MAKNPVGFEITNTTTGWAGADFDDVFIRKDCFLEGGLWSAGRNSVGLSGDNTLISRSSPVQTISGGTNWREISSKGVRVGAIKNDGSLWVWGSAYQGTLGRNNSISTSSPVQTFFATNDWKRVASGSAAMGAIKVDGTLWMWGQNGTGDLGDNTVISRSTPIQTVSAGTNWKSIVIGQMSAAIKTDGTLWVWGGANTYGTIGRSDVVRRSSPVQTISTGTNWKNASPGDSHIAAIKTDGTLWVWGLGTIGRLGTNNEISRSSPVQTVTGGTDWKQVSTGDFNTAAIKTDGTLWTWGRGYAGTNGRNNVIDISSPVQTVSAGTNWRTVDLNTDNIAAIKTDGTLWVWGSNDDGKLGINLGNAARRSSPVQTVSGGTDWKCAISGGDGASGFTFGIREDCW